MVSTKYKAAEHRVYSQNNRQPIIWLVDANVFVEVEDYHIQVISAFKDFTRIDDAMLNIPSFDSQNNIRSIIDDMIENRLLLSQEQSKVPQVFSFQPTITAFRIVLTEACNFGCAGCFSTTMLRKSHSRLRTMSRQTLEKVMEQLVPYGRDHRITLHFFGGEPLIKFDLIKRAVELSQTVVQSGKMLQPTYTITTNGFLITPEITDFFRKYRFKVGVSIEADPEMHDAIRILHRGGPTFEAVAQNYDKLYQAGVETHVLVTPYLSCQSQFLEKFEKLLKRFPSQTITINTPFYLDTLGWDIGSDYANLLVECERIAKRYEVQIDSALTPSIAAIGHEARRLSPQALIGDEVMVGIDPNGNVSRSTHKWFPQLLVGDLEAAQTMTMTVHRGSDCLMCEARYLCGGPNEEFQVTSGKLLDLKKCSFYKSLPPLLAANLDLFQ